MVLDPITNVVGVSRSNKQLRFRIKTKEDQTSEPLNLGFIESNRSRNPAV